MNTLNLRLSYHDMRMFAAMLQSLPVQAKAALSGEYEIYFNNCMCFSLIMLVLGHG